MKKLFITFLFLCAFVGNLSAVEQGQRFKAWRGVCLDKNTCGVEQLIFSADKKPEIHIFIRKVEGEFVMHARVPLYTNLEAGLFLLMGDEELSQTPYLSCYITGCLSLITLNDDLIARMRAANEMQIGTFLKDQGNKFTLSLAGFSAAIDSL